MADEHDTPETAIPFPERAEPAVPAAPTTEEALRNLYSVSAKLTAEIAFRERMCAEAVSAVLEKYGCVVSVHDGSVQIVNRK